MLALAFTYMYNVLYCVSGRERAADSNIRNAVHDLFYTNACNEAAGQYLNAERVAHSKNQSARAVLGRCAMVYTTECPRPLCKRHREKLTDIFNRSQAIIFLDQIFF